MAESTRVDHDHMSPVVRSTVYNYVKICCKRITHTLASQQRY